MSQSVEAFERLGALLNDALLLVTAEGCIRSCNAAALRLLAREGADVRNKRLEELCTDTSSQVQALLRIASRSTTPLPGALTFAGKGGSISVRVHGALYETGTDRSHTSILFRLTPRAAAIDRFLILNDRIEQLSKEIKHRRAIQTELEATSARLRVTLTSIGDAVIATDDQGVIQFMNRAAESLTGWTSSDAAGRALAHVFRIFDEETRQAVLDPVGKVIRNQRAVGIASHPVLIARDGRETPIADSGAPIIGDNGQVLGVVLVFQDVSERRALEKALRERTSRLEEAAMRRDKFLAMLAHELRNPLAPLRNGVHLLRHHDVSGERRTQVVGMLERQLTHMTRLIEDLLDVARLMRGRIEMRRARVGLQSVIADAVEMNKPSTEARRQSVNVSMPDEPITMNGDSARLVQVFGNLLSNASKFTDATGSIRIEVVPTSDSVVISVVDTGVGIEAALLSEVFDLFVQSERDLDRKQGGLGIGLTIVREIVEIHGGTVIARSDGVGTGSTFVVELPLSTRGQNGKPAAPGPDLDAARPNSPIRILVVDDNMDAAESLATILGLWNCDVQVAGDGNTALERFDTFLPEIILTDIGLPGMDGYELARRLTLRAGSNPLRIAAVSGYGDESARLLSRAAGCSAHFAKPVDLEALERFVQENAALG
jgi:PAS domain S-box-containing protein